MTDTTTGSTSDFLFGGNAPAAWSNGITSSASYPDWWQAASQGIIADASKIAATPYQAYGGPTVASQDPLSTAAAAQSTGLAPTANAGFGTAANDINSSSNLFNNDDFQKFLSPYTTAANGVDNTIAQLGATDLSQNLLPQVNDTFTKAGQFGSSGNADFTQRAITNELNSVLQQQSTANQNATNNAMTDYQNSQNRQQTAGTALGNLTNTQNTANINDINNTNSFGLQSQANTQENLDAAKAAFDAQTQAPTNNLNLVNGIIKGLQPPANTSTTPASSVSPLQSITALLAAYNGNATK